jgi:hypothetical protein
VRVTNVTEPPPPDRFFRDYRIGTGAEETRFPFYLKGLPQDGSAGQVVRVTVYGCSSPECDPDMGRETVVIVRNTVIFPFPSEQIGWIDVLLSRRCEGVVLG